MDCTVAGVVVSPAKVPPADVLHVKSAHGLLRGATDVVAVALQFAVAALICRRQVTLHCTVADGPVFATNPAS
jgi:hypothetical protein